MQKRSPYIPTFDIFSKSVRKYGAHGVLTLAVSVGFGAEPCFAYDLVASIFIFVQKWSKSNHKKSLGFKGIFGHLIFSLISEARHFREGTRNFFRDFTNPLREEVSPYDITGV